MAEWRSNATRQCTRVAWVRRTQAVFDTICANPVGRQIVARMPKMFIEARIGNELNAGSGHPGGVEVVTFTAENFDGHIEPGARADEMLVHEMLHVADGHFSGYSDGAGVKYAKSDFLTIVGANVYSSSVGRPLRAGHDDFKPMPVAFASPAAHAATFSANYKLVITYRRQLFDMFKAQTAPWNPFKLVK